MDCQYTSREQWSSIWTASTPVESNGTLYGHYSLLVYWQSIQNSTTLYWCTGSPYRTPLLSPGVLAVHIELHYTLLVYWQSIKNSTTLYWCTGSSYRTHYSLLVYWQSIQNSTTLYWCTGNSHRTPLLSTGVVVEFQIDCQYTSWEQWSSIWTASTPVESSGVLYGLPVHQQSSIWTASTPVESSGVLYGLPVHQQRVMELHIDCQ